MRWLPLAGLVALPFACNRLPPEPEIPPETSRQETPKGAAILSAFNATTVEIPDAAGSMAPSVGRNGPDVWLSWLAPSPTEGHALWAAPLADPLEPVKIAEGPHLLANWADVPRVRPVGDDLFAAYVVKPYELRLTRSGDGGQSWGEPVVPHQGTAEEFGFPVLFPAKAGVSLAWIQDGTVRIGGLGQSDGAAPAQIVDPRTCECCSLDVAMATDGPVLAYRDRSETEVRDISVVQRRENTWSSPIPTLADNWTLSGCPVNGPALDARGNDVVMVWFSGQDPPGRVQAALSTDGGTTFKSRTRLDQGHPLGRVDVVWTEDDAIASWLEVDSQAPERARVLARRIRPDRTLGPVTVLGETVSSRDSGFPKLAVARRTLWWVWTDLDDRAKPTLRVAHAPLHRLP